MWCVVSALGGRVSASSSSNVPHHHNTSQSHAQHPEHFRMQVEAIRQQGGAAWLALLNQMTTDSTPNHRSSAPTNTASALSTDSAQVGSNGF